MFEQGVEEYLEGKLAGTNLRVLLVDGKQFAGIIVDGGLEILTSSADFGP